MRKHGRRKLDPSGPTSADEYRRVCERFFAMYREWERLVERQRELARQFIEDDLRATRGPRRGQPLGPRGRRRRLLELLEVSGCARQLERALAWVDHRRMRLLRARE